MFIYIYIYSYIHTYIIHIYIYLYNNFCSNSRFRALPLLRHRRSKRSKKVEKIDISKSRPGASGDHRGPTGSPPAPQKHRKSIVAKLPKIAISKIAPNRLRMSLEWVLRG